METHRRKRPPRLIPDATFRAASAGANTGGEYVAPPFDSQDFILLI
jgi:hypothetical protein